jgi:Mce-associated membrane protein
MTEGEEPEGDQVEQEEYLQPPAGASRRPLIIVAAALLVAATFFGVLAARFNSELSDERNERDDVQAVAARMATALLTYDYRDLDASKDRVLADATGTFRREYEKAFTSTLAVLIRETKAQSKATVTDLFVSDVTEGAAGALVVVSTERKGVGGAVPAATSYIQLDLVKVGGTWKVDNVTNLNFTGSGTARSPASAPTTTTSAP